MNEKEKVVMIPISSIDDFPNHPFEVRDDEEMDLLANSISSNGVLNPVILRANGERFEIIAGHRRKYACAKIGVAEVPAIVREMTREEAIVEMVDSNLHREHILPSEKAKAYKMKMDAMKSQGKRNDLTSNPVGGKLKGIETAELVGEESGDSANQVRRYIRLNELVPELLKMVDEGRIALRPAVELSYLTEDEQMDLLETIESEDCTPSHAQTIRMRKLSNDDKLSMDAIFAIMTEEKGNQKEKVKIPMENLERFFPRGTPPKRVEETIIKALTFYQKHLNKKREDRDDR